MKKDLRKISENMKELGLAALSHANRIGSVNNDKWEVLSVLQIAHAAEILVKARIAKEHPLLIFEKFPKPNDNSITVKDLFSSGHTVEWSSLLDILWASTSVKITKEQKDAFKEFGKLRNGIQHFGVVPKESETSFSYLKALEFTYKFIDPFIYKCWRLCAIDYSDDYDCELDPSENIQYWDFIREYLVRNEIEFIISENVAVNHNLWWDDLEAGVSTKYRNIVNKGIHKNLPDN